MTNKRYLPGAKVAWRHVLPLAGLLFLTATRIAFAGQITFQYDNLDRLESVTHADGSVTRYKYDADGNRITEVVTVVPSVAVLIAGDLSFAATGRGATAPTKTLTFRNGGSPAMTITALSGLSPPFTVSANNCSAIAADNVCTVVVTMATSAVGSWTQLAQTVGAGNSVSIAASGSVLGATATLTQSVATTVSGSPYTLTWDSTGAVSCNVDYVRNGEPAVLFSTALSGSQTIAPPVEQTGVWSNTCFDANGYSARATYTHYVTALPGAAINSLPFGTVSVGSTATLVATLRNTGITALTLSQPSAASIPSAYFSFVSTTCGTSLAPGTNCTITVSFTPTLAVSRSGAMILTTSAGNVASGLSGTGI